MKIILMQNKTDQITQKKSDSLFSTHKFTSLLKKKLFTTVLSPWDFSHAYMPTPKLYFQENHQNPEHSIIIKNTSANISPHLWNKSGYQILQENHRAIYLTDSAQLRTLFWPIMHAVRQSNHFTTALGTLEVMQVSPFLSMVTEGHFSWDAFLNVWKHLLFTGDGFAGARSIDLAMLSLEHGTFLQMVPWLWQSIWLAVSQM